MGSKIILVFISFGIVLFSFLIDGINGRSIARAEQPQNLTAKVEDMLENIRKGKKPAAGDGSLKDDIKDVNLEIGTVPIPRKTTTGNDQQYYPFPINSQNGSILYNGGTEFVGIVVNQGGLLGASAQISIHHPEGVKPGQFSAGSIIIENGPDKVQAGWIIHPDLYHDGRTRLYTGWQSATSNGCYNIDCPGFVIVNTAIPLNFAFPQISNPNTGERHDVEITIQMGDVAGNWYLTVNGEVLGFWRATLFQNLGKTATSIRFGGQVYSHPPTQDSPPMGSGQFKGDNPERTAYMQNVQVRLQNFVPPPSYQKIDRVRCYLAGWEAYSGRNLKGFQFLFGGSGGHAGSSCLD